jgi:hypothetical protein
MTFPNFLDLTTRRFLPNLRDALAPDDRPAQLDYDKQRSPELDLLDGSREPIADPQREFVSDVLFTLRQCVGPLDIARLHGEIVPRMETGRTLDTAKLMRECRSLQTALAPSPELGDHPAEVTLHMQTRVASGGGPRIEASSKLLIPCTQRPLPEKTTVHKMTTPIQEIISRIAGGTLGAWLHACGDLSLTLHGRITSPAVVGKDLRKATVEYH